MQAIERVQFKVNYEIDSCDSITGYLTVMLPINEYNDILPELSNFIINRRYGSICESPDKKHCRKETFVFTEKTLGECQRKIMDKKNQVKNQLLENYTKYQEVLKNIPSETIEYFDVVAAAAIARE